MPVKTKMKATMLKVVVPYRYRAQQPWGTWTSFSCKPIKGVGGWVWKKGFRKEIAYGQPNPDHWRETLREVK